MKTSLRLCVLGLALGAAALPLTSNRAAAAQAAAPASNRLWADIKDDTYEQRAHFAAGAARMSAKVDEQVRLLRAKRTAMTTDTKDWDIAMKDVDESRSLLTSRITEQANATTPEAWADAKAKVGEAWLRFQLAVDRMNTTRTS